MGENDPIMVHFRDGKWLVNYGSYAHATYETRSEAVAIATKAARVERRELVIEAEA